MIGQVGIRRRLTAIAAAVPLLVGLGLAWQIRPPLPPMPRSFTAPFPPGNGDAFLHLFTWALFVALDLILGWAALAHGSHRELTERQRRLQRAFRWPPYTPIASEPPRLPPRFIPPPRPVMRLPIPPEPEPASERSPAGQGAHTGDRTQADERSEAETDGRIGIRLLGPFELAGAPRPRRSATAELIAYLVLHPPGASRDQLIEALYPGEDPERAADRLFQATPEARKLLGPAFHGGGHYRLDRHRLTVDLDQLDQLRARRTTTADREEKHALTERALALYRGNPLTGIDSAWADSETHRLHAIHLDLLEQAGYHRLQAGKPEEAIAAAEQGRLLDPRNERFTRLAMHADAALGRRDAIIERYDQLRRELDEQFGLEPERETKQLYRRLLSQDDGADRASGLVHADGDHGGEDAPQRPRRTGTGGG